MIDTQDLAERAARYTVEAWEGIPAKARELAEEVNHPELVPHFERTMRETLGGVGVYEACKAFLAETENSSGT